MSPHAGATFARNCGLLSLTARGLVAVGMIPVALPCGLAAPLPPRLVPGPRLVANGGQPLPLQAQLHGGLSLNGFVVNAGQWSADCLAAGRSGALSVVATPDALVLRGGGSSPPVRLRLEWPRGGSASWHLADPRAGTCNIIHGKDPGRWAAGLQLRRKLVAMSPDGGELSVEAVDGEISIRLRSGKDGLPSLVMESPKGADLQLGGTDSLVVSSAEGKLVLSRLDAADRGNEPGTGAANWLIKHADGTPAEARWSPDSSDQAESVSIGVAWISYLGGSEVEFVDAITVDGDGSILVAGNTYSLDFPVTPNALDILNEQSSGAPAKVDMYICRFSPDGTELLFATYLGGDGGEGPTNILPAADGTLTVVGGSSSNDYPVTPGVLKSELGSGPGFSHVDTVVTRLTADGGTVIWSTFLGGSKSESTIQGVLLPDGSVVVSGATSSVDFPTTDGSTYGGGYNDGFLCRVSHDGSSLVFSGYFGMQGETNSMGPVAWHPDGILAVGATTTATDFPFTPGTFSHRNTGFLVLTKDDTTGALLRVTAIGGEAGDSIRAIAFDQQRNVYIAGLTNSDDFPTTPDAYQPVIAPSFGAQDGFVSVFDPDLNHLLHSTFLGGNLQDWIESMVVGPSGLVTVAGITNSKFFPTTPGSFDTTLNGFQGQYDAFVARLDRKLQDLQYGAFVGGTGVEFLLDGKVALDVGADGRVALAVGTNSTDFPVTPGAFSTALSGETDAAVLVTDLLPSGVVKVGAATPGVAGPPIMGVTAMPQVDGDFALWCAQAPADSPFGLLLLSLASLPRALPAGGAALWVDPSALLLLAPVTSDDYGYVEVPVRVPSDPLLAGFTAAGQFAWKDPQADGGAFSASHALEITLQP